MKKILLGAAVSAGIAGSIICAVYHRQYIKGKLKRSLAQFYQNHKENKVEKDIHRKQNNKGNLDNVINLK